MSMKSVRSLISLVGFALVASVIAIPNPYLKFCVGLLGLSMSITWDGWYLRGICKVLSYIYTFSGCFLLDHYPAGIVLAGAATLMALGAKNFREEETFWTIRDRCAFQRNPATHSNLIRPPIPKQFGH
jgi:hypothetical protein